MAAPSKDAAAITEPLYGILLETYVPVIESTVVRAFIGVSNTSTLNSSLSKEVIWVVVFNSR